ncbi:hypothetical protein FJZ48_02260 [Candidatus Uhrbacteria bacterium]|nr:hypothetical protein [Candidatus Uhrbacteria bacterium]
MKVFTRLFFVFLSLWLVGAQPLLAIAQSTSTQKGVDANFNPNHILRDEDIFEIGIMSQERIQRFLESKKGVLATKKMMDSDGVEKWPAEIIWRVATSYKINPKYLLTLMQKEQSLVDDPNPSQKQFDWAMGYGVCDSCSMDDPAIQHFKGFASQVEWAAKQHREKYLIQLLGRGSTISGYAPGKAAVVDGQTIVPANQATAMLYTYTPHIHGNANLWRIWNRWFSLVFPDGSIVREDGDSIAYLIRFGEKRPFKSKAVLASMVDPEKIQIVAAGQLNSYPDGSPIAFANYSLAETPNGDRYLLTGNKKRHIISNTVFAKLGFNEDEVLEASDEELLSYDDGADITTKSAYPTGLLAKDAKGNHWYVEGGVRQLIPNKAFLSLYFKGRPAKVLTQEKLATLTIGSPYQLHEGELIRIEKQSSVYVIENGNRRPIISGEVFETLGWKWKNVTVLPAKALVDYPIGDPVTLQTSSVVLTSAE